MLPHESGRSTGLQGCTASRYEVMHSERVAVATDDETVTVHLDANPQARRPPRRSIGVELPRGRGPDGGRADRRAETRRSHRSRTTRQMTTPRIRTMPMTRSTTTARTRTIATPVAKTTTRTITTTITVTTPTSTLTRTRTTRTTTRSSCPRANHEEPIVLAEWLAARGGSPAAEQPYDYAMAALQTWARAG